MVVTVNGKVVGMHNDETGTAGSSTVNKIGAALLILGLILFLFLLVVVLVEAVFYIGPQIYFSGSTLALILGLGIALTIGGVVLLARARSG
jgi:hypothetical protein